MDNSAYDRPRDGRPPHLVSDMAGSQISAERLNLVAGLLPFLLLLLLAFALRLYRLDAQSIWVDEGISLHLATSGLSEIVVNRASNIHPPLYFFLLKGWLMLTGNSLFSARLFSALFSLFCVPVTYVVAWRWLSLGRTAAWTAAAWIAVSPAAVIYAQEARVYALLPLAYLILLALLRALSVKSDARPTTAMWVALGLSEWVALHLHYTALFLVAYVVGVSFVTLWRTGRRADLRRWFITQGLVGLACLPWLMAVITHWTGVEARMTTGSALAGLPTPAYLLNQIWNFFFTGLLGVENRPLMQGTIWIILGLLLALLAMRLAQPDRRGMTLRLTADWVLPLIGGLTFWAVRPSSHPRYLLLFAPGLFLLMAHLVAGRFVRLIKPAVWLAILLISFLGLEAYFCDPAFQKDDVRGVARYLEQTLAPGDLILVPPGDWSLDFVYHGQAAIVMSPSPKGLLDVDVLWSGLDRWTSQSRRVAVVDYRRDRRDWPGPTFFALESAGSKVDRRDFKGLTVHTYAVTRPAIPPDLRALDGRFGPLTLTQGWVESMAPTGTALTLACRWRLDVPTERQYGLTVRLLDADGWPVTFKNDLLLDSQIRPTSHWPLGVPVTSYHVFPIPPGTPPLTYAVEVGVYAQAGDEGNAVHPEDLLDSQGAPQGHWLTLPPVHLTAAPSITTSAYRISAAPPPLAQPRRFAPGLLLLGARIDRVEIGPGQSLFVILHWQAASVPLPDLRPRVALRRAGFTGAEKEVLAADESAPALGRYPTDRWQAGEMVIEHRRLTVPATAPEGAAKVVVTVGQESFSLGTVQIVGVAHTKTPPSIPHPLDVQFGQVARLIGYDLAEPPFTTTHPVTLTLYWEALAGADQANYAVFTHILAADGHLVGGHDGPPAAGARPTLGWIPGEIVTDRHAMMFHEPYQGEARIEVGLYEPTAMERVLTETGDSFLLLPPILTVVEP